MLVFDNCVHTGASLSGAKSLLEYMDFQDVRLGAFTFDSFGSRLHPTEFDYIFTEDAAMLGCLPLGKDPGIIKPPDSIYSERVYGSGQSDIAKRRNVRRYIVKVGVGDDS